MPNNDSVQNVQKHSVLATATTAQSISRSIIFQLIKAFLSDVSKPEYSVFYTEMTCGAIRQNY